MIEICDETEIGETQARQFDVEGTQIFVLQWQGQFHAYMNSCPHAGWPLNFQPDTFFNLDKTLIQCSNHMAMFEPATGECNSGPCIGAKLTQLDLEVKNGKIYVRPHQKTH